MGFKAAALLASAAAALLGAASALAPRPSGLVRRRRAPSASVRRSAAADSAAAEWSEEGEFMARVSLVEALRNVPRGDADVVSDGSVEMMDISATSVIVRLAEGTDAATVLKCEALVLETVRGLVSQEILKAGASVVVQAAKPPPKQQVLGESALAQVKRIVAVSSCKGGVGKSTVAVNLAFALKARGFKVGIVDADVHGPSLPMLVGEPDDGKIRLAAEVDHNGRELLEPFEKFGMKLMSFGYLSGEAAVMRGARVAGVVEQLTTSVNWGDLDYLVVDMPPGTGDVQLTLSQVLKMTAAVVVTTPAKLSFADVVKGISLFDDVQVPVVAVVENMAFYQRPLPDAERAADAFLKGHFLKGQGDRAALIELLRAPQQIFGDGSGQSTVARKLVEMWGIETAIRLAFQPALAQLAEGGGKPLFHDGDVAGGDDADAKRIFLELADSVHAELDALAVSGKAPTVVFDEALKVFATTYDGEASTYAASALRSECRCATCVDENSGQRRPAPTPPQDLRPLRMAPTGNYALSVDWSDGHRSLYPFRAFVPNYKVALKDAAREVANRER
ncbi:P-loop containing nucleoside triphosphate hydrolase protein [Pelagophyceae sp. CCMP2097]|nr:P-loop containing nucleoside triphosphate hydrolase protein [Pelagophyceae sp. CCMP2097]